MQLFGKSDLCWCECVDSIYVVSHRETIKYMNNMSGNYELEDETQKNKVRPAGRTLQKSTDDKVDRAFPIGNALFFFGCMMSLFRLRKRGLVGARLLHLLSLKRPPRQLRF